MVLGMLFENFKNYYILRYIIYEFLKKVLGVPQPTCLVRVFCAMGCRKKLASLGRPVAFCSALWLLADIALDYLTVKE